MCLAQRLRSVQGDQEGIPESQMYSVSTTNEIIAVAAMASAAPSPSRLKSSDIVVSSQIIGGGHYKQMCRESQALFTPWGHTGASSNLMKIMNIYCQVFSGKVAPPAHHSTV